MILNPVAPGPLLLAGSGEFTPALAAADRALLQARARPGRQVAIIPIAAGQEPAAARWIAQGVAHWTAQGAVPYGVPAFTAADAQNPQMAAAVQHADVLYYSGGRPAYAVRVLGHSLLWAATVARWQARAALAGSSAGMMMLGGATYNPYALQAGAALAIRPALGLLPGWFLVPHYNNPWMFAGHDPAALRRVVLAALLLVGLDEDTALLGTAAGWQVYGAGGVTLWAAGAPPRRYSAAMFVPLPPPAAIGRSGPLRVRAEHHV